MRCRAGGTLHEHTTAAECRACWGLSLDAPVVMDTYVDLGTKSRGADRYEEQWDEPAPRTRMPVAPSAGLEFDSSVTNAADSIEWGSSVRMGEEDYHTGQPVSSPVTEPGIYLRDGVYYKVQPSQSTGHLYAKKAVPVSVIDEDNLNGPLKTRWQWEYAKGDIRKLLAMDRITGEKAGEFGKLYNICVNCMKTLTREESMNRGYGPKCADNHGWPYDHSAN